MKIMDKLTKSYQIEVSNSDWMVVSKTINLYHQLITGPIYVKSNDSTVTCAFAFRIWNEEKVDMMLNALMIHTDGIEVVEIES